MLYDQTHVNATKIPVQICCDFVMSWFQLGNSFQLYFNLSFAARCRPANLSIRWKRHVMPSESFDQNVCVSCSNRMTRKVVRDIMSTSKWIPDQLTIDTSLFSFYVRHKTKSNRIGCVDGTREWDICVENLWYAEWTECTFCRLKLRHSKMQFPLHCVPNGHSIVLCVWTIDICYFSQIACVYERRGLMSYVQQKNTFSIRRSCLQWQTVCVKCS